jgi:glycosyltransferase involved in cell wall biosynthesis
VHVLSGGTTGTHRQDGFTVYKDPRGKLTRRVGTVGFLARSALAGRLGPALAARGRLPGAVWAAMMTRVSLAARIIEAHDIRVISAYNLLAGAPVGVIAAEMYRLPVVVTNLGEIYSHRQAIDRQVAMIRHITEAATVLTSLTRHCADSYRALGFAPEVRVLHYGIDRGRFDGGQGGGALRSRLGIPSDAEVVLYVGRLVRDMGLQLLLEGLPDLLGKHPSARVVVAGASGELQEAVTSAATRWPGRVVLAVDVPEEELPQFYAAATVVVAPTLGARACGSLVAAEAMAAGKPVVASRIGGIPEYVAEGETGLLVPPGDSGALIEAVLELLTEPARMVRLGEAGRARVAQLFDAERTDALLECLFREVALRR